ncbi:hypothetical protein LX32DRAFT_284115 [Colletotrichum zoysiae]|uniref:Uncharacterized protein n=1 Tax=Colletotrichum zoysiae TaxID=1216348 RepID=A0AAD9HNM2_9PEZI|nr:hypothetical protein LX32DRAFT_284115 [Colletotrichum zoysiae]
MLRGSLIKNGHPDGHSARNFPIPRALVCSRVRSLPHHSHKIVLAARAFKCIGPNHWLAPGGMPETCQVFTESFRLPAKILCRVGALSASRSGCAKRTLSAENERRSGTTRQKAVSLRAPRRKEADGRALSESHRLTCVACMVESQTCYVLLLSSRQ